MPKKLQLKMGNIVIGEADLDGACLILAEEYQKEDNLKELNIKVAEESKIHPCMSYTTDFDTLKLIFQHMTFRSSSLSNANLNDPVEKERVGISEFAKGRFITCFCHEDHECIPFWMYYGKHIRKNKILLQFQNFASKFEECIHTDYALVAENKKCLFNTSDYGKIVNSQYLPGFESEEYDLRGCIDAILMFDVEYVPITSEIFSEDNSGKTNVSFGESSVEGNSVMMRSYDPRSLGKQKSDPWEYEKETRVMSVLSGMQFPDWNYIDLRLKPEIFRNLKIVLSPWDEDELRPLVEEVISNCSLPQDIKDSIQILDSGLKGKLNFPENEQ